MKKLKSKDVTDEFLGGNAAEEEVDEVHDLCKKLGGLPTTEQLATIAATLARNPGDDPLALTVKALDLWLAARENLFRADHRKAISEQNNCLYMEFGDFSAWISKPDFPSTSGKYPVTRDQFLRVVLPKYKNRTADLARFARCFLQDTLADRNGKKPTQDEVNDAYSNWKSYEGSEQANDAASKFKMWLRCHIIHVRRDAGRASAKKKAALKKARRSAKRLRGK